MGYELDPLPSYHKLRNCSYSIMLNYIKYLSTLLAHLQRLGPTIVPSGLFLKYNPPWSRVHVWCFRPPFTLWYPAASECTPLWGGVPRIPLMPPPGGTPTPWLPCVLPSSLWSSGSPGDGIPPDLQHLIHHHPAITAVQEHQLCHRLIHHPPGPHRCSCIFQHPRYHPPPPPFLPQVLIYCWTITVVIGDCLSEVREGLWRWQGLWIDLEPDPVFLKAAL